MFEESFVYLSKSDDSNDKSEFTAFDLKESFALNNKLFDSPFTQQKFNNLNFLSLKKRELSHNESILDAIKGWNCFSRRFFLCKKSTVFNFIYNEFY